MTKQINFVNTAIRLSDKALQLIIMSEVSSGRSPVSVATSSKYCS